MANKADKKSLMPAYAVGELSKATIGASTMTLQDAKYDRVLVWTLFIAVALGFVMVSSSSMMVSELDYKQPFHFIQRHLIYMVVSLIGFFIMLMVPTSLLDKYNKQLCLCAIALLIWVYVAGPVRNGSARWIMIAGFTIQASEVVKLFFYIYVASFIHRRHKEINQSWEGFVKVLFVMSILAILLLLQPDMGAVLIINLTAFGVLFLAGARIRDFLALGIPVVIGLVVTVVMSEYRMQRIDILLDPWIDPIGKGYQLIYSLITFGNGGVFGQGLGNSLYKLRYLPEAHTDFVFAILSEELGFVGAVGVIGLLMTFVYKAMKIGRRAVELDLSFAGYLAYGIGIWIFIQSFINMSVASALIPTTGITLPFISYGGTSLVVFCAAIGILVRIDYEVRQAMQGQNMQQGGA